MKVFFEAYNIDLEATSNENLYFLFHGDTMLPAAHIEYELEQGLMNNVQKLLLKMGKGFAKT